MPNKIIPGRGPGNANIVVLGEAPGEQEELYGQCFVGPTGQMLDSMLRNANISPSECYFTNVCKIHPPGNDLSALHMLGVKLEDERDHLITELNSIRPNVIIALGATALWALSDKAGIQKWRGSILQGKSFKFVPTLHPAGLLHQKGSEIQGQWAKYVIEADFRRAKEESGHKELELPRPFLHVIRDSRELYDFLRRNEQSEFLSIDIEAHKSVPNCVGLSFVPNEGVSVPLWEAKNETDQADMWLQLAQTLGNPRYRKIGQNFKYDEDKLYRIRLPIDALYADTMLMGHTANPEFPKSLAFLASLYTRHPYYKDEGRLFNPKKDSLDQLFLYNARDAVVTLDVFHKLQEELRELGLTEFYYTFVQRLHSLYAGIEKNGFLLDEDIQAELIQKYGKWAMRLDYELYKLTGEQVDIQSPKQVAALLYDKLRLPKRRSRATGNPTTDEKALSGLLASGSVKTGVGREVVGKLLEARRVRKTIGTYLTSPPDYDGRTKTSYFIVGTETGRTSTQRLQPPVRPEKIGLAFQTITKHGDIGGEIRKMLIPEPGYILVNTDFAQAEARVVCLLAEDYETLKLLDEIDIHALTASWIFGGTWETHSKSAHGGKETSERFIGKTCRHAGNLDIGKNEFARSVTADARKFGIELGLFSPYKAGKCLTGFHKNCPNIQGVFHQSIRDKLGQDRVLVSPHGRRRLFMAREGRELYKPAYSFIPQATVSDHTKDTMLRFPHLKILAESHDSFCFQAKEKGLKYIIEEVEEEMLRPINFEHCSLPRGELVIPCEFEVGTNYKDLEPYEWRNKGGQG